MLSSSAALFQRQALETIETVVASQHEQIRRAGGLVADAVTAGGMLHAFGSGHSEAVAMELAGRAGGLIPTNRIAFRDLVIFAGREPAALLDDKIERDPAVARALVDMAALRESDVVVVASSSGLNGAVVEFARLVGERGVPLIALTSVSHSTAEPSRHPSGAKLIDLADVVLDNGAPHGDALIEVAGDVRICGISSITSATLAQLVVATAIDVLLESGHPAPVYRSANITGGDDHNHTWELRYSERLRRSA